MMEKIFSYALRCSWLFRNHWPGMEAHLGSKCHTTYIKENPCYVTESPFVASTDAQYSMHCSSNNIIFSCLGKFGGVDN